MAEARGSGSAAAKSLKVKSGDLLKAANQGEADKVQELLAQGAVVEVSHEGWTPLLLATFGGHVGTCKLLLDHGADKEATVPVHGSTALILAVGKGHMSIAELLLDQGAAKEAKNANGRTALHIVAERGHLNIAELLFDRGAETAAEDRWGCRPLHLAVSFGHMRIAELLLDRNAAMEAKTNNEDSFPGSTPLHRAAGKGLVDMTQLLLSRGANANAKDTYGDTPAQLALARREAKALRVLPGGPDMCDEAAKKDWESFMQAKLVHVISTRYFYPEAKDFNTCCDPNVAASVVKIALETESEKDKTTGPVKVFDPNTDNAFLMRGVEKEANGIWLKNWRHMLQRAQKTGGKVIQILVDKPSHMQDAEADMADDKGVPVIKIDLKHLRGHLEDRDGFQHREDAKKFGELMKALPEKMAAWTFKASGSTDHLQLEHCSPTTWKA